MKRVDNMSCPKCRRCCKVVDVIDVYRDRVADPYKIVPLAPDVVAVVFQTKTYSTHPTPPPSNSPVSKSFEK